MKYKKHSNKKVSEHFNQKEFDCSCNSCDTTLIDDQLIHALETLRRLIKKPIHINSAYRCTEHNKAVGGAVNSQHPNGKAADITVSGLKPDQLHAFVVNIFDGIGLYNSFVHVDVRGNKARWGKKPVKDVLPEGPSDQDIEDKLKGLE